MLKEGCLSKLNPRASKHLIEPINMQISAYMRHIYGQCVYLGAFSICSYQCRQ